MKRIGLFLLLLPFWAAAQVDLNLGLIAHYPFSGNANDISGNNIHGTVFGATLTTDRSGSANSAYYFNGTSAYIQLPFSALYNFAPQDSFSISVWVLPDLGHPWPAQAAFVKAPPHPDFTLSAWNYGTYVLNYKGMSGYAYNHILNGTTTFTTEPCWYNITTTYKNGVWRMYINGVLESSDLSQSRFIIQDGFSRIAIGRKGESSGDYFKGKIDDIRLYNRVLNAAEAVAITGTCLQPCPPKSDFAFTRDPCQPLTVNFSTLATGYSSIRWDFGDGNSLLSQANVTNVYAGPGNYPVRMILGYGTCTDTIEKTISLAVQQDNQLITTNNSTLCAGGSLPLSAMGGLQFCWSPVTGLDNPLLQNPVASPTQSTTYFLTAETPGPNLIINGDFSAGNTGFTSAYTYAPTNLTEGEYFVGPSPQAWNGSLSNCQDHTGNGGNMLLVNGSPAAGLKVWSQTVAVTPNTNYAFSTWIQALSTPNPAQLRFSINNNDVGGLITAPLPTCTWTRFYSLWNSGNSTTATISIVNRNTQVQGNDFALDDISFTTVTMRQDSVRIMVDRPAISTSNDLLICQGQCVQLQTTGGVSYAWTPASGLSNANIPNPVATPASTTSYIVTGTNSNNCSARDTVLVTVNPTPVVTVSNDTAICRNGTAQLQAAGGTTYSWSPATGLSNPALPNPLASPSQSTLYTVTVTDAQNCRNTKTVSVRVSSAQNGSYLLPTAFTPNNDGLNDCFGIKHWGVVEELEFNIYNRWGQRIFFTRSPDACWDGTYQGIQQDANVFVYMIRAKTLCDGEIFRKGTFLLIR